MWIVEPSLPSQQLVAHNECLGNPGSEPQAFAHAAHY